MHCIYCGERVSTLLPENRYVMPNGYILYIHLRCKRRLGEALIAMAKVATGEP